MSVISAQGEFGKWQARLGTGILKSIFFIFTVYFLIKVIFLVKFFSERLGSTSLLHDAIAKYISLFLFRL